VTPAVALQLGSATIARPGSSWAASCNRASGSTFASAPKPCCTPTTDAVCSPGARGHAARRGGRRGGVPGALPAYDLKPEHDSYYEVGLAQDISRSCERLRQRWQRNAWNVLDTTQIFPTPIFATFNNALGLAHGVELRLNRTTVAGSWYLSATYSQSVAAESPAGRFSFPPDVVSDTSLNPEDHDQALSVKSAYTLRWATDRRMYAPLAPITGPDTRCSFRTGRDDCSRISPSMERSGERRAPARSALTSQPSTSRTIATY